MSSIAFTWRKFLDGFYYFREWLTTLITYISLHIYASEISWNQIKNGKMESTQEVGLKLEDAKDLDLLLSEVKCRLAEEENRRNATTDKCKSLITLSSLVLAASGIVVSKANFDSIWTQIVLVLAALSLLHVVVLISMHFAVGTDKQPTINQHDASLSADDLRKSLINTYLECQADRNNRVNFLVELYKGARFYFLLGLTFIIGLLVSTFPARPKEDLPSAIAKQLTDNATLIERLGQRIASIENSQKIPSTNLPAVPAASSISAPNSDSEIKSSAHPPTTAGPSSTMNSRSLNEATLPVDKIKKSSDEQESTRQTSSIPVDEVKTERAPNATPEAITPPTDASSR